MVSYYHFAEVPYPEQPGVGLDSFLFNSCGTNTGQFGPYKEECVSYYESLGGNTTEVSSAPFNSVMNCNNSV